LWQVAQETLPERESLGSKNRALPSVTFSGVAGLALGCGTPSGRRKRSFSAVISCCEGPSVAVAASERAVTT
jgi:hypothetical protein